MKLMLTVPKAGALALASMNLMGSLNAAFADDFWSKPAVKQGVVGAAVGAGVGALSDRSTVTRGAVTGAATGVGTGLVTQSKILRDKPLVRNTAQGAIIGTGASYATHRDAASGAVVGAGAGAGYHFLKKYLNRN